MADKLVICLLIACWLGSASGQADGADDPLASRRGRIERMTLAEKEQLLRRHEQFHSLDPEEQERLHDLHREIEKDPNRDELRQVMDRYYDWLKSLSSYQLMELRKLPPEERIKRIRSLQEAQRSRERGGGRFGVGRFGPGFDRSGRPGEQLLPADREALLDWAAAYAARHEEPFMKSLPGDAQEKLRRELDGIEDSRTRSQVLFWRIWLRRQLDDPKNPPLPVDEDWPALLATLSPQMRKSLQGLDDDERRAKFSGRIRSLAKEHYFSQRFVSVPSVVSEEELARYVTNDLDQRSRSWLFGVPSSEMPRMAFRIYLMSKLPDTPKSFPPMGPGAARRPGPQRHGPPQRGNGIRPEFGRPGPSPGGLPGARGEPPRPGESRNRGNDPEDRSATGTGRPG